MEIKIFVSHTPDSHTVWLNHPLFYNVIAGSDFQTKQVPIGVYQDNQGENISSKNKSYCELTTQYWAWKNIQADYYGFCHYRRLFSFVPKSDKTMQYYDYPDEELLQELGYEETKIRELVTKYDFLMVRGTAVELLHAKNVYEQYKNAPDLHIEDVDTLLQVLKEKYPHLYQTAQEYMQGQVCYFCNMFIAKRELFLEYSNILFDVLQEVEKRTDLSNYSKEGYRTIGHLGERMAGIYYLHLKKQGTYRLVELQRAFFHHADADPVMRKPAEGKTIPIVLAANQKYVPMLHTCLHSIVKQAQAGHVYDIYIFHTNMEKEHQFLLKKRHSRNNVHVTLVNVSKQIHNYKLPENRKRVTEKFFRLLVADILSNYQKAVYLDCDTIVCRDLAQLYDTEMGNALVAATYDIEFAGQCNRKDLDVRKYGRETLGLENPFVYFQAGVLVLNIAEWKQTVSVQQLLEQALYGGYRSPVSDIMNMVCKGRVKYLDLAWNMLADSHDLRKSILKFAPHMRMDDYEQAKRQPNIIHYAGDFKPWLQSQGEDASIFWETARETVGYESLLRMLIDTENTKDKNGSVEKAKEKNECDGNTKDKNGCARKQIQGKHLNKVRRLLMKVLHKESRLRRILGKIYWSLFG